MYRVTVLLVVAIFCSVECKPLDSDMSDIQPSAVHQHGLTKRFISPMSMGGLAESGLSRIRFKRSEDECEKLALCKLHARSSHNFFAAYELYFVNKENARLWDHRARSVAECQSRYQYCYDEK